MARILIVDDDQAVLAVIGRQLRVEGHEVVEARNGREAAALLEMGSVDLVVTDIYMPEMGGIEFLIRLLYRLPQARIIAISGGGYRDKQDLLERARALGAVRTLAKPFSRDELVLAVNEVLESGMTKQRVAGTERATGAATTIDVLIVDDDEWARSTLTKVLRRAGFMAVGVYNGLAALAALQKKEYKAVVCDIRMPFVGGKRFYRQLMNELPEMANRVIFVTGRASDAEIAELAVETDRPVLAKPINSDELITAVRSLARPGSR